MILLTHTPMMRRFYYGEEALLALQALVPVRLHESERPLDLASLIVAAEGVSVIVADRRTPGPAAIFTALPRLEAFVRVAVDIRNVDLTAASRAGVLVTRASPGFVPAVAEMAVGMMIDLARNISYSTCAWRSGQAPDVRMGRQLQGSILGIIGYGAIGRYFAPLGHALGMRVLVADPYAKVEGVDFEEVSVATLLSQSDFVVCLASATEETERLMDAAAFALMKPGSFFINVSRGNLVDEPALVAALRNGPLAGAAIDVGRAPDQQPSPELIRLPNLIATPHVGGLTPEAIRCQAMDTVEQVRAILAGTLPTGAVNSESWTRRRHA